MSEMYHSGSPRGHGTSTKSIPPTKWKLRKPNPITWWHSSPMGIWWWDTWNEEHTRDGGKDSEVSLHRDIVQIYKVQILTLCPLRRWMENERPISTYLSFIRPRQWWTQRFNSWLFFHPVVYWSLSSRIRPGMDWLILNWLGETKWSHQNHSSCRCLVKDNG